MIEGGCQYERKGICKKHIDIIKKDGYQEIKKNLPLYSRNGGIDSMNELQAFNNFSNQTPIEIAL